MQSAFANMALTQQQAFKPAGFWHAFKDYDGEPINVAEHQDAQEFLTRLQVCWSTRRCRIKHCWQPAHQVCMPAPDRVSCKLAFRTERIPC